MDIGKAGSCVVLASALLLCEGASALSPADRCEAKKLKTAAKYGFCRLKAESKAVKAGGAPDFSKCDPKLSDKWTSTEADGKGQCPSNGDEALIQAFITQHTDDLAAALAGGPLPNCPACGNGAIDGDESCDQGNLNAQTCVTQGFTGGTLKCGSCCAFDTSGCWATRFADNANGTITDNQTGLEWEKKVKLDSTIDFANPRDADNYYQWAGTCSISGNDCQPTAAAAALCTAKSENGNSSCAQCGGGEGTCSATTAWTLAVDASTASFGGHTDWRVPKREELVSIVDYADTTFSPVTFAAFQGASCGGACTDITNLACSCTKSSLYWSASSLAPFPTGAWLVNFVHGIMEYAVDTNHGYVRLVLRPLVTGAGASVAPTTDFGLSLRS